MKLPRVDGRRVIKALSKAGFVADRQKGSHVRLVRGMGAEAIKITVPVHSGKPLKPVTLLRVIKDSGLTREEFLRLL